MIIQSIPILEQGAHLTLWLHERLDEIDIKTRPAILVIPGGGYEYCSVREGEPIAASFYNQGYQTAVLEYSVKEKARNWQPILEGFEAMRLLRKHAAEWNILPDRIVAIGFSAGAHLAACLGVMWRKPEIVEKLGYSNRSNQPNALILCYPVISGGEFAHRGSFFNLSGEDTNCAAACNFSADTMVHEDTPPTFLWHTCDDGSVPVENTLLMASALRRCHVPFEVHIFHHGSHGLSLCREETNVIEPHCANWMPLCEEWLKETFSQKPQV